MKNTIIIFTLLIFLKQETKKYAWREEIKDMEGKWQTLEEKSSNKMKEIYSDVSGDDLVFCKKPLAVLVKFNLDFYKKKLAFTG